MRTGNPDPDPGRRDGLVLELLGVTDALGKIGNGPPSFKTDYHGVRFRSQLESRFARHLHQIDEMWLYEPRIFGPYGRGYLPDFELPAKRQPTFVEVKPSLVQVRGAKAKMSVIWETHPDALLIIACSEASTWFASLAGSPWESWVERWKSR